MPKRDGSVAAAALFPPGQRKNNQLKSNSNSVGEELRRAARFLTAAGIKSPELDAQVLLASHLHCDRSRLFSGDDEDLGPERLEGYRHLLVRRAGRLPVPYVIGRREFWSLDLKVDKRVLVPRPETEVLVQTAIDKMPPRGRLLDLGTGSGNVVVAVAEEVEGTGWIAVDISEDALKVARENIAGHGLDNRVSLAQSDIFDGLAGGEVFDVIVSNPPYIPTGDIASLEPEIRCHEPRCALDGGCDGLEVIRRIIKDAPAFLSSGGWLIMEIGDGQDRAVADMLRSTRMFGRQTFNRDLEGRLRVVSARRR